jgi:hypothetical protein
MNIKKSNTNLEVKDKNQQPTRLQWSLKDPYHGEFIVDESKLPQYRDTRDDLKERLGEWLNGME